MSERITDEELADEWREWLIAHGNNAPYRLIAALRASRADNERLQREVLALRETLRQPLTERNQARLAAITRRDFRVDL